jgi:phosphatidylglycerophosphate synthase
MARTRITPNQVTVATFVLAVLAAALIAAGRPWPGLAVWILSRAGDGLDGALARATGRTSAFGGFLDITLDMAGYSVMVLGFAVANPALANGWMAVLAGYTLVITTTLALSDAGRAAGRAVGAGGRTFQFTAGFTEAGETSVIYGLWVSTAVQRSVVAAKLLR